MNIRTILTLFSLCFLVFGISNASIFFINGTQGHSVSDFYWNDTDEYSAWLSYENPYGANCEDLRSCYLDDSNSNTDIDDTFMINSFFNGDSNIEWVLPEYSFKDYGLNGVDANTYFMSMIFNDTSQTNTYHIAEQRGTMYKIHEVELTHEGALTGNFWNSTYFVDAGNLIVHEIDETEFRILIRFSGTGALSYTTEIEYKRFESEEKSFYVMRYKENGTYQGSIYFSVEYADNYILGYTVLTNDSVSGSPYIDYNDVSSSYTTHKPFNFQTSLRGYNVVGSTLDHNAYLGGYQYQGIALNRWVTPIYNDEYMIGIFPKIAYVGDGSEYSSVSFPSCEDIAIGNEQTDFWYNETTTQFWRQCEGIVPTPETYSCDTECLIPSYPTSTEICSLYSPFFLSGSHSGTFRSHILQPTNYDGWGYCFLDTQNLDSIVDMRLYSALYNMSYLDNTQTQGLYGITSIYDRTMFGKSCDSGVTNTTLYFNDVNSFNGYLDLDSNYWDWDNRDSLYNNVEVLLYSWLYDNNVPETACELISYPLTNDQFFAVQNAQTPNKTASKLHIWIEYDNQTSDIANGCYEYETFCYPEVPVGYVYDEDDIVCIGASCYVEAGDSCNLDGVCDTPFESNALCPEDCPTATTEEQVDIITDVIDSTTGYLAEILGTDDASVKGMIWMVLSLIVAVGLALVLAKAGADGIGIIVLVGLFIMMLIGTLILWLPLWVGLIFLIMDGFLIAFMIKSVFV